MEAIVEYNYEAREVDELTLRKGDIIKNIKVSHGGWWEGTLRDKRGMFPDNFVKVLDTSASVGSGTEGASAPEKSEEVTLRNGASGRRWCRVLFSYEPLNPDELKLVPQESIEFLGEVEEGWWRGRLRGQVGVFPSNFVSQPTQEEKELYRVLFPYEAVNEDELSLVEGDIITLVSKDAPDKGWWKGELKGQTGLFPDNFVELIGVKNDSEKDHEQRHDSNQGTGKASSKLSHTGKRNEKAHARKSLDTRNIRTGGGNSEKKLPGNHSLISSLKRLVGDGSSNNSGNGSSSAALGEELDEVERGEGMPLSHLTASRAKAPRRRPPTTMHLRHHATTSASATTTNTITSPSALLEENMTNGNVENVLKQTREDEGDGVVSKTRLKAPWVEELKLNQLERKKIGVDRVDKVEVQKERVTNSRLSTPAVFTSQSDVKFLPESEETETKEKEKVSTFIQKAVTAHTEQASPSAVSPPPSGYVPFHVYNQLLERVALLEENQAVLQRTVNQLAQFVPMLSNYSVVKKE